MSRLRSKVAFETKLIEKENNIQILSLLNAIDPASNDTEIEIVELVKTAKSNKIVYNGIIATINNLTADYEQQLPRLNLDTDQGLLLFRHYQDMIAYAEKLFDTWVERQLKYFESWKNRVLIR